MQTAVETAVESLCQSGCKAVWGHIEALQAGKIPDQTADLSELQRQQVLRELKSIMAVYEETSCSVDSDADSETNTDTSEVLMPVLKQFRGFAQTK